MKNIHLIIGFALIFITHNLFAIQLQQKMLVPAVIDGEQVASFIGKKIEYIRIYVFHDKRPILIPFQIDQKDQDGHWVWQTIFNSHKHKMKEYDNEDPKGINIFDANDQIVFMRADTGEKNNNPLEVINTTDFLEVKISLGDSMPSRWIYITYHPLNTPPLSSQHYMTYHKEKMKVSSPVYSFMYSKKNISLMDKMILAGQEVIDKTTINGKVDVSLLLFNSSIEFNEKEIRAYPVGILNGPIRIIKQFVSLVNLGAGIQSMSLNVEHIFYPNHTEVPVFITKGFFVKNMSIKIGSNYPQNDSCQAYKSSTINQSIASKELSDKMNANTLQEIDVSEKVLTLNNSAYSMLTLLKIPDTLQEKIMIETYIAHDDNQNMAGFSLKTKDDFPAGQYEIKMISIFSDQPDIHKRVNSFNENISVLSHMTNTMHIY